MFSRISIVRIFLGGTLVAFFFLPRSFVLFGPWIFLSLLSWVPVALLPHTLILLPPIIIGEVFFLPGLWAKWRGSRFWSRKATIPPLFRVGLAGRLGARILLGTMAVDVIAGHFSSDTLLLVKIRLSAARERKKCYHRYYCPES